MRATGIVRRMDDLGRVVIPKEIRRQMGIKEGDPLEIFTTHEGGVCFKKYCPIGDNDWAKAKTMLKRMLAEPFALFDRYGDCQAYTSSAMAEGDREKYLNTPIYVDGEVEGYLVTTETCANVKMAAGVLGTLFDRE